MLVDPITDSQNKSHKTSVVDNKEIHLWDLVSEKVKWKRGWSYFLKILKIVDYFCFAGNFIFS